MLAWRLSNSLGADVAVAALEDALAHYGVPETMNTDQGSHAACEKTVVIKRRAAKGA